MLHGYLPYLIDKFVMWAPALVIAFPGLALFGWHLRIQGQRNEALRKVEEMEERLAQMEDVMSKVSGEVEKLTDDQRFTTRLLLERDGVTPALKG